MYTVHVHDTVADSYVSAEASSLIKALPINSAPLEEE